MGAQAGPLSFIAVQSRHWMHLSVALSKAAHLTIMRRGAVAVAIQHCLTK